MDEHSELRNMIAEGKDKLEWYRQVDPAKLNTLKDLINAPNYKENMATLIRTIYEFAFVTYAGKLRIIRRHQTKVFFRFTPRTNKEQQHEETGS